MKGAIERSPSSAATARSRTASDFAPCPFEATIRLLSASFCVDLLTDTVYISSSAGCLARHSLVSQPLFVPDIWSVVSQPKCMQVCRRGPSNASRVAGEKRRRAVRSSHEERTVTSMTRNPFLPGHIMRYSASAVPCQQSTADGRAGTLVKARISSPCRIYRSASHLKPRAAIV